MTTLLPTNSPLTPAQIREALAALARIGTRSELSSDRPLVRATLRGVDLDAGEGR